MNTGNSNSKELLQDEQHVSEQKHVSIGQFIKSAVYGGLDGIITIFNIVFSAYASGSGVPTVISLGVSSLIADGLAMGIADLLATQSDAQYMGAERQRQKQEIVNDFSAEKQEMACIYGQMGLQHSDSKQIVNILSTNEESFLNVMMIQQLGMVTGGQSPIVNSIVTFLSFAIFGLMPLLPFIVAKISNANMQAKYLYISGALTIFFLFVLGFSKSIIVLSKWYLSGGQAILIGALSAGAAYGFGKAFGSQ